MFTFLYSFICFLSFFICTLEGPEEWGGRIVDIDNYKIYI